MNSQLFPVIVLCLFLFSTIGHTQQISNMTGPTYGAGFRGKQIWLLVEKNPDGTWNNTYRDNDGNPLSELECSYLKGYEKLDAFTSDFKFLTLIAGPDAPNSMLNRVIGTGDQAGFGVNPSIL